MQRTEPSIARQMREPSSSFQDGPHPHHVAPIVHGGVTRLIPPPARLVGIVRAIVHRDMRGVARIDSGQLLTQFSVNPATCLSWYTAGVSGLLTEHPSDPERGIWEAYKGAILLSGLPTLPKTTWMPEPGAGYLVVLWPDALQRLFGLAPAALLNQSADAFAVLPPHWHDMLSDLLDADTTEQVLKTLEHFLAPGREQALRDQSLQGQSRSHDLTRGEGFRADVQTGWARLSDQGRAWLEQLAIYATQRRLSQRSDSDATLSERQVERRIKAFTGQSMRQWKSLIRDEAAFHIAADKAGQNAGLELSDLAYDAGYADQAHMGRAVKRLTGFSPAEFNHRYRLDESFWLYRLWGG